MRLERLDTRRLRRESRIASLRHRPCPGILVATMTPQTVAPVPAEPALACGNCRQPMRRLALEDHYRRRVDLDLCADCHLVWFDLTESARLGGLALLELIDAMAAAQRLAHVMLRDDAACPRCRGKSRALRTGSIIFPPPFPKCA